MNIDILSKFRERKETDNRESMMNHPKFESINIGSHIFHLQNSGNYSLAQSGLAKKSGLFYKKVRKAFQKMLDLGYEFGTSQVIFVHFTMFFSLLSSLF